MQPSLYYKKTNEMKRPILIIDIEKNVFSYFNTDNTNPCYKVVEFKENIFKINADEYQKKHDKQLDTLSRKEIRIDCLKWYAISEIHSLPKLIG